MRSKISEAAYKEIIKQLSYIAREKMGIIGSSGKNVIDRFILDTEALSERYHCKLSILNASALLGETSFFVGIVHSHPSGKYKLSDADLIYARKMICASKGLPFILMGIVSDDLLHLYWVNGSSVIPLDLLIV